MSYTNFSIKTLLPLFCQAKRVVNISYLQIYGNRCRVLLCAVQLQSRVGPCCLLPPIPAPYVVFFPPHSLASVLERRQRVPPAAEEHQPQPVSHDSGDVKHREHVQPVAKDPRGTHDLGSLSTEHSERGARIRTGAAGYARHAKRRIWVLLIVC